MRAVLRHSYGGPEVLTLGTAVKPTPKADELLVRVAATTVNRTDCGILRGQPLAIRLFTGLLRPKDPIPGTDFAGTVEAVGADVRDFRVGDRVWGFNDEGLRSQADYLTIRASRAVARIPDNCSFEQAAASAEGAHYARNFLNKVTVKAGTRVLVNGATGAIGSAALQLLKHQGAYVTAVGNTPKLELLRSLGADEVIDYLTTDFTTAATGPYDLIVDAVGKSTFARCRHLLTPRGIYISSELGPNAQNLYLPLTTKLRGGPRVIFPVPTQTRRSILLMTDLLATGAFIPVIDRRYPLADIREAYAYVESGVKTGNVIVVY